MNDEQVAAILGLVLMHLGGSVEIPYETVQQGLPPNSGVNVESDEETGIVSIYIAEMP